MNKPTPTTLHELITAVLAIRAQSGHGGFRQRLNDRMVCAKFWAEHDQ